MALHNVLGCRWKLGLSGAAQWSALGPRQPYQRQKILLELQENLHNDEFPTPIYMKLLLFRVTLCCFCGRDCLEKKDTATCGGHYCKHATYGT
mmetsp:Transcript_21939/g.44388  ORF Transcript_21939/g.44388 Transcript_21939/m.44388 type:complete len:93 (-) Transcript_21939:131-409(-)